MKLGIVLAVIAVTTFVGLFVMTGLTLGQFMMRLLSL